MSWSKQDNHSEKGHTSGSSGSSVFDTKSPFEKHIESTDWYEDEKNELRYLSRDEHVSLTDDDLQIIAEHLHDRTLEESIAILERALEEHADDPCLSSGKLLQLQSLIKGPEDPKHAQEWEHAVKFEAFLIHDWSIYPEVRAVTRPIDENGENYVNFRVIFLGVAWACAGCALDTFFANRWPQISLGSNTILILIVYSGKAWAQLPEMSIPLWRGRRFWINRGPWTFKEQMLATLTMSVSVGSPYSLKAIVAQSNDRFFGMPEAANFTYIIMLTLSSAFMGFGIAGILRVFLVYPTRCIWYSVLPSIAVCRSLTEVETRPNINGWRLRGWEFFMSAAGISFVWYWVTNYFAQFLSYFDWPAWISPQRAVVQGLFGCINGLALNPINTFDWNNIGPNSIITPVFSISMQMMGMLISAVVILIIWFKNVTWTSYLPVNGNSLYDNRGNPFNVSNVLNQQKNLDLEKLRAYSAPFWTAGTLVTYGAQLMTYPAMIVYAGLNYSNQILGGCKIFLKGIKSPGKALDTFDDRFSRAQRKYKEVPELWFLGFLVISLAVAIACLKIYSFTNTPIWTIFFGIGLSVIFCIPFGYLYSTTTIMFEINILYELILGYAIPGNAQALMVSKVFATNFFSQGANYLTNQVTAHYTGIAPRGLFIAQTLSVLASCLVQSCILWWQVTGGVPDMCDPLNHDKFTCQTARGFFNAGIQWGLIGPRTLLQNMYPGLKWCMLVGVFYPIPFWIARTYLPRYTRKADWLIHHIHEMAVITAINWAPNNLMTSGFGLFFTNLGFWGVKKIYPLWWSKYAYILANSLDVGVGYAGLLMFFATEYKYQFVVNWWGNNVPYDTGDARAQPLLSPPAQGWFGPPSR